MHNTIARAEPWIDLPTELAEVVRPHLDQAATEIIHEIQRSVPEYARPLHDPYVQALHLGVEQALRQFVERIAHPTASWEPVARVYREIGRCEAREGRSLDALQAAMRLGARVAWRRLAEAAHRLDLPPRVLTTLAEAIFVYLDEIAGASAAGYAEAQAAAAGELERRRRRLLDLVLADPPASPEAIAGLARSAKWPLPRTVAAVALEERGQDDSRSPLLPPEMLVDLDRREPCVLVPDADGPGRARMLDLALRDWRAAVGPTVPLADAARSLGWARDALALARGGVMADSSHVIRCVDHMSRLIVFRDAELVRVLGAVRLAPLEHLRPAQRDRLAETLLSWLQTAHNTNEVALRLGVHPQTVRYRVRQLEELFGSRLHDPDTRFELEIALRARQALAEGHTSPTTGGRHAPKEPEVSPVRVDGRPWPGPGSVRPAGRGGTLPPDPPDGRLPWKGAQGLR